jgi:hypothetical protein
MAAVPSTSRITPPKTSCHGDVRPRPRNWPTPAPQSPGSQPRAASEPQHPAVAVPIVASEFLAVGDARTVPGGQSARTLDFLVASTGRFSNCDHAAPGSWQNSPTRNSVWRLVPALDSGRTKSSLPSEPAAWARSIGRAFATIGQQGGNRPFDLTADGRFVIVKVGTTDAGSPASSMVLVLNWQEELRQRVPTR